MPLLLSIIQTAGEQKQAADLLSEATELVFCFFMEIKQDRLVYRTPAKGAQMHSD